MHLVSGKSFDCKGMQDEVAPNGSIWRWLIARLVALCDGMRWSPGGAGGQHMLVLETLSIGSKKQLVLVRCEGETYLIATGPETVQAIHRVEPRVSNRSVVSPGLGERS